MSATEELHRMLDERGVKYREIGDATFWETHGGAFRYKAESHAEKLMVMTCCSQKCTVMTPEQAVEATLGRGTCEADETETIKCWVKCKDEPSTERMELIHVMECSECGHTYEHVNGDYEFCPRCGRKRVDE